MTASAWIRDSNLLPVSVLLLTTLALLSPGLSVASTPGLQNTAPAAVLESNVAPLQQHPSVELDRQMAAIIEAMIGGDIETATRLARSITSRYPDFALAQLLVGELHALAALDPLQVSEQYAWSPRLVDLLLEARRRLEQSTVTETQEDRLPTAIIQAGSQTVEILLVDISDSTLYRYENQSGTLQLRHKHYVSSGRGGAGKQLEGDLKTPIGLYRITESLIDAELPALYGHGALVLDYPNALDRRLGKTGHGIWLHGNPAGQISRAPYSSEGCVTMTNEHVALLMNELPLARTQVVLSESVMWQTRTEARSARAAWLQRFANWQRAWLDDDVTTLEALYHPSSRPILLDLRIKESLLERVSKLTDDATTASSAPDNTDRQLLEPADRKRLAALQSKAVSILANPYRQGDSSANQYVKMSLPLESAYAGTDTVLWWSLDDDGNWRIVAEERGNPAL